MAVSVFMVYMFIGGKFTGLLGNLAITVICGIIGVIIYTVMLMITREETVKNIINRKG